MTTPPNIGVHVEDTLAAADLPVHDWDLAEAGIRALLRLCGEDPNRPGLADTPTRVVRAFLDLTTSDADPTALLSVIFDDAGPIDEMVAVGPITFTSLCEHHLLPFTGRAWVAYVPHTGVVGLSKIPRLVDHYARRPQVQERLTANIAEALRGGVPNLGVGVMLNATHTCASMRGVKKEAPMTTTALYGVFREDPAARAEFLSWARDTQ